MTPHKVQCLDNNGEPYGRYVRCRQSEGERNYLEDKSFIEIVRSNIFPFPSGTIGKTYEIDEVEVTEQIYLTLSEGWIDIEHLTPESKKRFKVISSDTGSIRDALFHYRQIFRLTQPVEKEPETVSISQMNEAFDKALWGKEPETVEQAATEYADSQHTAFKGSLYRAFIAGVDWQKKQEASR